ncbi:MAG TPA: hypothetical protein PLV68_13380 [Ilumatobacteraceae bacterium]|nr:hypothetical protein [Ilumatobacteraceae bacterium]
MARSGKSDPNPLQRMVDLAVFAPIGLAIAARSDLPRWAKLGRRQLATQLHTVNHLAKVVIGQGRSELTRRLDAAEAARTAPDPHIPDPPDSHIDVRHAPAQPVPSRRVPSRPVEALPSEPVSPVAVVPRGTRAAANLQAQSAEPMPNPIDGYDSLAASQVVARLNTLSADELAQVKDYEAAHRSRQTILAKVDQLLQD